jgi:putative ABC transport system permease protein
MSFLMTQLTFKKLFKNTKNMKLNNLLTQTLRSLSHQKGFAALNFIGLSMGLTVSLLVGLMVFHERSFDNFHADKEQIYRLVTQMNSPHNEAEDCAVPATIVPKVVQEEMSEVGQWSKVHLFDKAVVRLSPERFFEEKDMLFADTAFFSLFNFKIVSGNAHAALTQPNQVLLTETTSAKYFPNENAIGKRLTLEIEECLVKEFDVAGIVADAPVNSHLSFKMLISAVSLKPNTDASWGWFNSGQYLYLKPGINMNVAQIEARITALSNERKEKGDESTYIYRLQPLADIHTNMAYAGTNPTYTADVEQFYWLGAIALFLLLIAAINYVNLATAIAQRKAREVGVRKTLGASRWQLALRFWFETFLLVLAAQLAAVVAAHTLLPILNQFLDKQIVADWTSWQMLGFMAVLGGATTFLAGFYPAFVLAGFSPVDAFRGKFFGKNTRTSLTLRRSLVMFQFVVAQVFMVAVIVAATQMHFIRSKPLGFLKEGVLDLRLPDAAKPEQISAFRSELTSISGLMSSTYCTGAPTSRSGFTTRFNRPENYEQNKLEVAVKMADPTYLETYGLGLVTGRFLNESDMAQSATKLPDAERKFACVLNETAVKNLGYTTSEAVLGQKIRIGINKMEPTVVGVVKDFHTRSLRNTLQSVAILSGHNFKNNLGIRLEPAAANALTLSKIESVWKTTFPADLFTAAFIDDYLASLYHDENQIYSIFKLVALLALLINALGLIGLTVFVVEAKTKEIGIRKVLGASVAGITSLLAKDFLKLVIAAIFIASPIAYYFMQQWLADFAYRIDIQAWMFVAAGVSAALVAALTVSFQSVKAALANPVKSLRSE